MPEIAGSLLKHALLCPNQNDQARAVLRADLTLQVLILQMRSMPVNPKNHSFRGARVVCWPEIGSELKALAVDKHGLDTTRA